MNCPVCNRNNANTLSICPSCGAMINDSVREELKGKISAVAKIASSAPKRKLPLPNEIKQPVKFADAPKPIAAKTESSEINSPPASPTLIEFHSKNTTVPEWRLQLQNTVRQRQDRSVSANGKSSFLPIQKTKLVMSGATALKAQPIENAEELENTRLKNPTLSSALERINNSRRKFLLEEEKLKTAAVTPEPPKPNKQYPFHIAGKADAATPTPVIDASPNFPAKPTLAAQPKIERPDSDANGLAALPKPATTAPSFEKRAIVTEEAAEPIDNKDFAEKIEVKEKAKAEIKIVEIKAALKVEPEAIETVEAASDEIDDCAPFAMRFNAGLFDLIIGSFGSLLLLAPFMLTGGGSWLTLAGVAAFLATCAVVMFVYLTAAIGKYGKTVGMRLFSLEVIDIEDEQYPTLHQAAVSSSLYLVSLAFGGLGFLTMLFNEEKRAVHDLVSGTVVVKEF